MSPKVPDPRRHAAGLKATVFAEDQPEYDPLPALVDVKDPCRTVTTEWEPTAEELAHLLAGGRVCLQVYTFGNPLQPILLSVLEP